MGGETFPFPLITTLQRLAHFLNMRKAEDACRMAEPQTSSQGFPMLAKTGWQRAGCPLPEHEGPPLRRQRGRMHLNE
jgi:hypothetical protein